PGGPESSRLFNDLRGHGNLGRFLMVRGSTGICPGLRWVRATIGNSVPDIRIGYPTVCKRFPAFVDERPGSLEQAARIGTAVITSGLAGELEAEPLIKRNQSGNDERHDHCLIV